MEISYSAGDVCNSCFFSFGFCVITEGNAEDGAAETGRNGPSLTEIE